MNAAQFDYLIVGSGIYGATAARVLVDAGKSVAVIERRGHVAGNCYDETVEGVRCCLYGGHIFHTNSPRVWQFVNHFAEWQQYTHRVASSVNGKFYSFPVNLLTLNQLYGAMSPEQARAILNDDARIDEIRGLFYRGYSEKQWGKPYDELPAGVRARVPFRDTYDDRYFTDTYQGLPVGGYTALIKRMLENIPTVTDVNYLESPDYWRGKAKHIIYTGAVDELFGYEFGHLEYRSLRFENRFMKGDWQGCATVNYPAADVPYTRILEHKHFGWQTVDTSVITVEYPQAHVPGENEPFYPVRDAASLETYEQYRRKAEGIPWLTIGGRLGMYQYLNMDQAVGAALTTAERLLGGK